MKVSLRTAAAGAMLLALCACASHTAPASATNGESIFQTGKDSAGNAIAAARPPLYPSCVACHKADGSGGVKLPGGAVSADLRHDALVTKQKHPYTLATLQRAIAGGVDNEGKKLDPVMPRWKLSPGDLHDVAVYVTTLK
ncbi:MAG: cytochrome c [Candidatus Eremiobacteraeota bacterium]|nr:cytochrome c [Candidatus Eremiobacteraeota bacterium]